MSLVSLESWNVHFPGRAEGSLNVSFLASLPLFNLHHSCMHLTIALARQVTRETRTHRRRETHMQIAKLRLLRGIQTIVRHVHLWHSAFILSPPPIFPQFGVMLMVVENAVLGAGPESPIMVQFGWYLMPEARACIHTHTHTLNPLCSFETPLSKSQIFS